MNNTTQASDSPFVSDGDERWDETWKPADMKARLVRWIRDLRECQQAGFFTRETAQCVLDVTGGYDLERLTTFATTAHIALVVTVLDSELADWHAFGGPGWPVESLRDYLTHGGITRTVRDRIESESRRPANRRRFQ